MGSIKHTIFHAEVLKDDRPRESTVILQVLAAFSESLHAVRHGYRINIRLFQHVRLEQTNDHFHVLGVKDGRLQFEFLLPPGEPLQIGQVVSAPQYEAPLAPQCWRPPKVRPMRHRKQPFFSHIRWEMGQVALYRLEHF